MRALRPLSVAAALLVLAGSAACRARPAAAAPPARMAAAGDPLAVEHCWWSTNRSALPPDSIAARFQRAYATVGFADARTAAAGDTAWVQTAPTAVPSAPSGIRYAMHAVAYQAGDSTHYRYFLAAFGPGPAPRTSDDTSAVLRNVIPLCTAVARAAAIPGVQPAERTGEEALAVWRWRR